MSDVKPPRPIPPKPCEHGGLPELCDLCKAMAPKRSGSKYILKVRVRDKIMGGFRSWGTARVFDAEEEALRYLEGVPREPWKKEVGIWFKGKRIR